MRRIILALAALAVVALACGDITGIWTGPVQLGIDSGDGQVVEAGRDSLIEAVVVRAVRAEGGGVAFTLGPVPLHAQTVVGTGVPNVLTQARPIGSNGLRAFVDYATTDNEGRAPYWFEPGTRAGQPCAEIRAIVEGQPEVVAVACAEVEPGPIHQLTYEDRFFPHELVRVVSDTAPAVMMPGDSTIIGLAAHMGLDRYQNAVVVDSVVVLSGDWLARADTGRAVFRIADHASYGDTIRLRWLRRDGSGVMDGLGTLTRDTRTANAVTYELRGLYVERQ